MQILYQIADPIKAIIAYVIETNKLGGCQKERGSKYKSLSLQHPKHSSWMSTMF